VTPPERSSTAARRGLAPVALGANLLPAPPVEAERHTPARPAAVLVPAGTLLAVATLLTASIDAASRGVEGLAALPGALLLAAFAMSAGALLRVVVVGRWGGPLAAALADAGSGLGVLLGRALLGADAPGGLASLACFALAAVGGPLAASWRRRWMRFRRDRVSVLAPDVRTATAAVWALETIPHLAVRNILVPGPWDGGPLRCAGRPVLTSVEDASALERRVVVSRPLRDERSSAAIARLVAMGREISSVSAEMRRAEGRVDSDRADPLALLLARRPSRWASAGSRLLDVLLSAVGLALASPVLLVVSIAVLLDSGWPVLFVQERVGRNGRRFRLLKFRSMRRDAETASGPVWASRGDPRVTRIGRFLRRSHLDELPQLWNVLTGSMSLVGPRPERPHFFEELRASVPLFDLRTCVRPGITGWAQVRLPYAADADDCRAKLEYDLYYVLHRSMWFDLAILFDTVAVALRGTGSR
jgi:exopolysaccharide biosynthesis polyprenyl glycosylphosphotransferase